MNEEDEQKFISLFYKIQIKSFFFLIPIYWEHCFLSCVCMNARLLQSCSTVCDTMNSSLPGSFVHGILQERILELGYCALLFLSYLFLIWISNILIILYLHFQKSYDRSFNFLCLYFICSLFWLFCFSKRHDKGDN